MVWTKQEQKILRKGGKNTQKNCTKKDLHDPDNHDGVITHLEPRHLEWEVKWALGSITTNKASGGDSNWAISNPERWCCKSATLNMPANLENSAVGKKKLSSGHRTGKRQLSFQSQRKRQCQRMFKLPHNCTHLTYQQSNAQNSPS